MSIVSKIWKIFNSGNTISTVTANINGNLKCGGLNIQRFISKRFTIGRNCKNVKQKKEDCGKELNKKRHKSKEEQKQCTECNPEIIPEPTRKKTIIDVCTPFRKKERKIGQLPLPANKKKPKCRAGMVHPCLENECLPLCGLTKGAQQKSCDECPKKPGPSSIKDCPPGDWERGE